ncbi:MAG TPA: helix-turn-helix transcriptional regulator [Solirubrobacterales bacterium]|jgi:transcriptional regulator with XRE-family HTH domain
MAEAQPQSEIGSVLRHWRESKHLTQLDVALDAGVSARHLSFVETGRSRPGREALLRILEQLGVPFRERNRLLLAAGYAPAYPERALDDPDLAPVRDALDLVLSGHEPYPAVAVDRVWNMVAANSAMLALTEGIEVAPELLEPPINVIRIGLHPRGLAPLFVNLGDWHAHWVRHLEHQVAATKDERLAALLDEIASYPVPGPERDAASGITVEQMLGPVRMRARDGGELAFFGMFATFDTPFEVTTSELAVELLFPADRATAERLQGPARASGQ